jgi:transcription elongation factor Elf1
MDPDTEYEYSFCCPNCGARVSLGQALAGGKIVCTTCGGEVPLPGLQAAHDQRSVDPR